MEDKNLSKSSLKETDFEDGFETIKDEDKIESLFNTIRNGSWEYLFLFKIRSIRTH